MSALQSRRIDKYIRDIANHYHPKTKTSISNDFKVYMNDVVRMIIDYVTKRILSVQLEYNNAKFTYDNFKLVFQDICGQDSLLGEQAISEGLKSISRLMAGDKTVREEDTLLGKSHIKSFFENLLAEYTSYLPDLDKVPLTSKTELKKLISNMAKLEVYLNDIISNQNFLIMYPESAVKNLVKDIGSFKSQLKVNVDMNLIVKNLGDLLQKYQWKDNERSIIMSSNKLVMDIFLKDLQSDLGNDSEFYIINEKITKFLNTDVNSKMDPKFLRNLLGYLTWLPEKFENRKLIAKNMELALVRRPKINQKYVFPFLTAVIRILITEIINKSIEYAKVDCAKMKKVTIGLKHVMEVISKNEEIRYLHQIIGKKLNIGVGRNGKSYSANDSDDEDDYSDSGDDSE